MSKGIRIRSFDELIPEEQAEAERVAFNTVFNEVLEVGFPEEDDSREAQAFRRAVDESERLRTPWFLGEIILEDSFLRNFITEWARREAAERTYSNVPTFTL